ncbi:hypothetical protein BVIET440_260017 [Burkholderia vietnamiensis]
MGRLLLKRAHPHAPQYGRENRLYRAAAGPPARSLAMRGRLARSSGRARLLRAGAEHGIIDRSATPCGGRRSCVFLHLFCQPCPSTIRRFPVPSSCRSTRSCPKNRC